MRLIIATLGLSSFAGLVVYADVKSRRRIRRMVREIKERSRA